MKSYRNCSACYGHAHCEIGKRHLRLCSYVMEGAMNIAASLALDAVLSDHDGIKRDSYKEDVDALIDAFDALTLER